MVQGRVIQSHVVGSGAIQSDFVGPMCMHYICFVVCGILRELTKICLTVVGFMVIGTSVDRGKVKA